jgi:hypothetical protein
MDSISLISAKDRGAVIVCGSHGGLISGAFATLHPPHLVIFNDAGGGKSDAGRASIDMLDAKGIACATVSHSSARIGDAEDAWTNGVLSAAGSCALQIGVRAGQSVKQAVDSAGAHDPAGPL